MGQSCFDPLVRSRYGAHPAMEELLEDVAGRMAMLVQKPSTRVQACQLLAKTKDLQREVDSFELPDLEAEYTEEEGDRLTTPWTSTIRSDRVSLRPRPRQ